MNVRAYGAYEITLGKLQLQPFVSVKETWTDNVFTTSKNEQKDRIQTTLPGVKAVFPFRAHGLEVNYHAVLTRYDKFTSEKTNDHAASALLDFKLGSKMTLAVSDAYKKNHEPRASSSTGFIEKYTHSNRTVYLTYRLVDRSKIQFDYSNDSWKFRTSTFRDRRENSASVYLYYRFLPKTSAFVEYDRKTVDFSEVTTPLDNRMTSTLMGVTWEISRRSKGTIKFGESRKDFQDDTLKDHNAWASSVDINHSFTRSTSIILTGQRAVNEANRIGTRFFITTGVSGEVNHRFGYRLSSSIHGSYGIDEYSDVVAPEPYRREDRSVACGGGLKYSLRESMEIGVDYTYKVRDSNIDTNDYREHQYSVLLSLVL